MWAYGRGQTDTHTHTDTQTRVTTIHFASSTTNAKCNKLYCNTLHCYKNTYPHSISIQRFFALHIANSTAENSSSGSEMTSIMPSSLPCADINNETKTASPENKHALQQNANVVYALDLQTKRLLPRGALSVRPSVTSKSSIKTPKYIITQTTPHKMRNASFLMSNALVKFQWRYAKRGRQMHVGVRKMFSTNNSSHLKKGTRQMHSLYGRRIGSGIRYIKR